MSTTQMHERDLWLVGSGQMARAYADVLKALNREFTVVGRGAQSAAAFRKSTGGEVIEGGLQRALNECAAPQTAILATGVDTLADLTCTLLDAGVKHILVEKPAGLSSAQVERVAALSALVEAQVKVAYNRRFFKSVLALRERIVDEGGLQSITFDFTEMSERVYRQNRPKAIMERWLLANSTHVIDLAFHLAGTPKDWCAYQTGMLDWHPSASIFAGAGKTDHNVTFAYTANWNGPGRWGLELVTAKRRYILRPIERLSVSDTHLGPSEEVSLDFSLDESFKPGIFRQVQAFLSKDNRDDLCDIRQHRERMRVYERIAGYV